MINIALVGASGKMGQALIRESLNDEAVQVTNYLVNDGSKFLGSDVGEHHFSKPSGKYFSKTTDKPFDCIIDFATRKNLDARLCYYKDLGKPLLFCTTGLNQKQKENTGKATTKAKATAVSKTKPIGRATAGATAKAKAKPKAKPKAGAISKA